MSTYGKHRWLAKCTCALLALVLTLDVITPAWAHTSLAPLAQETTVSPASLALSLMPGESATETITVKTAPTPIPRVDVLFLFE